MGRLASLALLVASLFLAPPASAECVDCHRAHLPTAADPHAFIGDDCASCHRGDDRAADEEAAHAGVVARPGHMADAAETCGACHLDHVENVAGGLMHTGRGMVSVTRFTFGESPHSDLPADLADLGDSPADSYLRKMCASCHLGQELHSIGSHDPIGNRGGGCLACHLPPKPDARTQNATHPALTAQVSDANCVGCHSRSGRISLNYAGMAEVDDDALRRAERGNLGRLPDGRLVEVLHADLHHQAGMGCVDCHTIRDVMGPTHGHAHASEAVDIQCADCHDNRNPRARLEDFPADMAGRAARIPFATDGGTEFLTTGRKGTPLWHVELAPGGPVLHRKTAGGSTPIPQLSPENHPANGAHDRLSCAACHTEWIPQCYGCHVEYDPEGASFDHVERRVTLGNWLETRWLVRNERPPLGVGPDGLIRPFLPGMVRTIDHPDWDEAQFRRLFGPLSPHTTNAGIGCADCHRSSRMLGLGEGMLEREGGEWTFFPALPILRDGMAADAMTTLDGRAAETTRAGARPFAPDELRRILDADLDAP
ncbi:MAG: hypothetical protein ACFCUS_08650 [Rubrimonas sp.]